MRRVGAKERDDAKPRLEPKLRQFNVFDRDLALDLGYDTNHGRPALGRRPDSGSRSSMSSLAFA